MLPKKKLFRNLQADTTAIISEFVGIYNRVKLPERVFNYSL